MSEDGYVVEVKRSARKVSPGAGRWVRENGIRRLFESKALAREWARSLSPSGRSVWIQDAAPWDGAPIDGYVVGGRRVRPRRHASPGEQASLVDGRD